MAKLMYLYYIYKRLGKKFIMGDFTLFNCGNLGKCANFVS